ncbi:MAG: hypothetical protein NT031_01415 [Planctomycetota bacterium]|nr:hypothetical protein [Planctomycetota bacterium]
MSNIVGLLAAVAAGAMAVRFLGKRMRGTDDRRFLDSVLGDAAGWLVSQYGGTVEAVHSALADLIHRRTESPMLEQLVRLEWKVVKVSPTTCRRTVVVAVDGGDRARVGSIETEVPWETLPSDVRRTFIRERVAAQCFVLFDRVSACVDG